VAELEVVHAQRAASKRIAFDAPWTEAVLRVLETTGYRAFDCAPSGDIARRLGSTSRRIDPHSVRKRGVRS
jgi:hypothetical protein